jgi:ABC-2 type transport system permease protein
MSGFWTLLRLRMRRDRWQLVFWALGCGLLAVVTVSAVAREYGDGAARAALLQLATGDKALLVLRGTARGADLGPLIFFQIGAFLAAMTALMSTFLAVRHSRADEESGIAELVGGSAVGRLAPFAATLAHGGAVNAVVGVVIGIAFAAGGLDPAGSLVAGLACAGAGIVFVAIGLVCAQLMRTSRAANSLAASLVGVAYLLRGLGDANGRIAADQLSLEPAWPSLLSPIGWAQATNPYSGDDLVPLIGCVLATVAFGALGAVLLQHRDAGSAILPERPGRASARRSLNGTFALTLRLQRGSIVGWCVAGGLLGLLMGTLSRTAIEAVQANPAFGAAIASIAPGADAGGLRDHFIAALMGIVGITAAGCATQLMMRARQEEANGTGELILSTGTSRVRWFGGYLLAGALTIVLVLLVAGLLAAAAYLANGEDASVIGACLAAAAAQLPAALLYLGLTGALVAVLPRATIPAGWLLLTVGLFLGQLGGLIGAPDWLRDISPFVHTPALPGPAPDFAGGIVMLVVATALAALGALVLRRRDLTS